MIPIGKPEIKVEDDAAYVVTEMFVGSNEEGRAFNKTIKKELIMTKEAFEAMYNKWIRGVKDVDN